MACQGCGWRRVTRAAARQPRPCRMETCDTEEPDEGKPHVRICGGLGRAIAEPTRTLSRCADALGVVQAAAAR